jgi:hypothetical protein
LHGKDDSLICNAHRTFSRSVSSLQQPVQRDPEQEDGGSGERVARLIDEGRFSVTQSGG